MQSEVTDDIRTIFNAPDRTTADAYLAKAVLKYEKVASRLSDWMANNLPEGLMVFSFPEVFENCCARQMVWKDSTEKYDAEPGASRSFRPRRDV